MTLQDNFYQLDYSKIDATVEHLLQLFNGHFALPHLNWYVSPDIFPGNQPFSLEEKGLYDEYQADVNNGNIPITIGMELSPEQIIRYLLVPEHSREIHAILEQQDGSVALSRWEKLDEYDIGTRSVLVHITEGLKNKGFVPASLDNIRITDVGDGMLILCISDTQRNFEKWMDKIEYHLADLELSSKGNQEGQSMTASPDTNELVG